MLKIEKINPLTVYQPENKSLLNRLRFLTNGGWGRTSSQMIEWLECYPRNKIESIWVAYLDDEIIGWGATWLNSIGVYVQKKHRNKGYGTEIAKKIRGHFLEKKTFQPEPISPQGYKMYKKAGFTDKDIYYRGN